MLISLNILKYGGIKTVVRILTSTNNPEVYKIGKNSKIQSRRQNVSFFDNKIDEIANKKYGP